MENNNTSLLIVEKQDLLRQGLESIFSKRKGFDVVGSESSAEEAIKIVSALNPQIVVLGVGEDGDNAEICAKIVKDSDARVLLLAAPGEEQVVASAFRSGASGCLLTSVMAEDLIETIRLLAKGQMVLPQDMARETLIERRRRRRETPNVSPRELEVLELMGTGISNKAIAEELHLSEVTVKTHVSRILKKLGQKNRMSAILYASARGWIELPS